MSEVAEKQEVTKVTNELVERVFVLKALPIESYQSYPIEIRKQMENYRRISSEIETIAGVPTMSPIRGLTKAQELVLSEFHQIISCSPKDKNFGVLTDMFWKEFTFKVFEEQDMKLNGSYTKREEVLEGGIKKLVKIPQNISDYMKIEFALKNSKVANSKDEVNTGVHTCLIEDLSTAKKRDLENLNAANEADKNYVKLMDNDNQIDWMVTKLEVETENHINSSKEDKLIFLREKKTSNPIEFNKEFKNPNLEHESIVFQAWKFGIIIKDGDTFYFEEKPLGTLKETAKYLLTPTNSPVLEKIKRQISEVKLNK